MKKVKNSKKIVATALLLGLSFSVFTALKTQTAQADGLGVSYEKVFIQKSDSLKEITKPHVGFYECKEIYFNGETKTDEYKNLTVELTAKNQFILRYQEENGKKIEKKCKYSFNPETGVLKLKNMRVLWGMKSKITLQKGEMNVLVRFGKKNLKLRLEQI
mgnify:CR=1 FL=1